MNCDVAIIGGGPGGSTVGAFLKKHAPYLDVHIFEREVFPRDHVGESQLPMCCDILHEMGAWDKVERAGFPIKVGAVYRWGSSSDLWQFEFLPGEELQPVPRPSPYRGQRARTAFQVDRAQYDTILLDHARELGCQVHQPAQVREVLVDGDTIAGLEVEEAGQRTAVQARCYFDASGTPALLRRKLGIGIHAPTSLRNIAIWDYWQDARWADRIGIGGTKVRVMSLGWGWLWFIPISPTRTSIGLVTSAEYYKQSGKTPEELYLESIAAEPMISDLTSSAAREGKVQTTTDWSYVADRICGANWFLVGDSCGFADPILAAGMTLAHTGARKAAFTFLEIERGKISPDWLRREYNDGHRANIRSHIRFADYWYSANAHFSDLKEYTREIARDAGLELSADAAFQWLGSGGFTHDILGQPVAATFQLTAVKWMASRFTNEKVSWGIAKLSKVALNVKGLSEETVATYRDGGVGRVPCYRRDNHLLPKLGHFAIAIDCLRKEKSFPKVLDMAWQRAMAESPNSDPGALHGQLLEVFESMYVEGWMTGEYVKGWPTLEDEWRRGARKPR